MPTTAAKDRIEKATAQTAALKNSNSNSKQSRHSSSTGPARIIKHHVAPGAAQEGFTANFHAPTVSSSASSVRVTAAAASSARGAVPPSSAGALGTISVQNAGIVHRHQEENMVDADYNPAGEKDASEDGSSGSEGDADPVSFI
jgi:hypothetical protein